MTDLAGQPEFVRQLRDLGYLVDANEAERVTFAYVVPCGRFRGASLQLCFEVPGDFPRTPPHGPHFSPALLPVNSEAERHPDRVHKSPFGPGWIHWSRPHPTWETTDRSVAAYLTYVKALFCTIVVEEEERLDL